jgi:hypothetical protein
VVKRVIKVEMTFLLQWRIRVRLSEEGGQRRWYGFSASVSARKGRRRDVALSEDEADAASLSWLHEKVA